MKVVITGGAGFIGINAAYTFLAHGYTVILFDNLSRQGSAENFQNLKKKYPKAQLIKGSIEDHSTVQKLLHANQDTNLILHFAAQVAVTTSISHPLADFNTNALGTLNLLESYRENCPNATFLYASTNKVYGELTDITVTEGIDAYHAPEYFMGINESRPVDYYSPYGCSKGSADQYVHDYSRIYGLKTIVFRQSCIIGKHQFGMESQGWVSWLMLQIAKNNPVTIYGTGKQVRDVLSIDDLTRAVYLATQKTQTTAGQIYNIGGGPSNTLSILMLMDFLKKQGLKPNINYAAWRAGDQKLYISDIQKAKKDFDWQPELSLQESLNSLYEWVQQKQLALSIT